MEFATSQNMTVTKPLKPSENEYIEYQFTKEADTNQKAEAYSKAPSPQPSKVLGADTYVLSAMHASEIARSVNMQANLEDQEGYSGY